MQRKVSIGLAASSSSSLLHPWHGHAPVRAAVRRAVEEKGDSAAEATRVLPCPRGGGTFFVALRLISC
jgi:hypothetical protein